MIRLALLAVFAALLAIAAHAENPTPVLRGDELETIQRLEAIRVELARRREKLEQELIIARFSEQQAQNVVSKWLLEKSPDPKRCRAVDAAGRWQCEPEVPETAKDGVN